MPAIGALPHNHNLDSYHSTAHPWKGSGRVRCKTTGYGTLPWCIKRKKGVSKWEGKGYERDRKRMLIMATINTS